MVSNAKLAANRKNAGKSTGPTSAQGRARVSQNAVRHGLLSRDLVLPHEDPAEFAALLQGLVSELLPRGTLEQALVDRIAIAMWRQRRLVQVESAQVELQQAGSPRHTMAQVGEILEDPKVTLQVETLVKEPMFSGEDAALLLEVESLGAAGRLPKSGFEKQFPRLWFAWCLDNGWDTDDVDATPPRAQDLRLFLLQQREVAERGVRVSRTVDLVRQARALPEQPDTMARYQSALDNDLYKAMRALRDQQRYRREVQPPTVIEQTDP